METIRTEQGETATTITAAFADSNAISKLREYLQPLWGSLSRQQSRRIDTGTEPTSLFLFVFG
jgi:hypothetical protein